MVSKRDVSWSVAGLLIIAATFASPARASPSLWTVSIDNGPAPPPAQRPPFSRGARRDPSLLIYQIPGIVGGYVGFVLILGFALLIFGRRLRRDAQSSRSSLSMEMVKPLKRALDPSPISPSDSTSNWWKWGNQSQNRTPSMGNKDSPTQKSIVSFDDKVIEKDKAQRQEEMERIYAVVMSDVTKAPSPISVRERDFDVPSIRSPTHVRNPSSSSRSFSQRQPPHIREAPNNNDLNGAHATVAPAQAIYPPPEPTSNDFAIGASTQPTVDTGMYSSLQPSNKPVVSPPRQNLPKSPRSGRGQERAYSHSRQSSTGSNKSRTGHVSVRNLQISSPIPVPAIPGSIDQLNNMDDRAPLSPHYIPSNPPRPPSPPQRSRPQTPIEDDDDEDDRGSGVDERPSYYSEARGIGGQRSHDQVIHAYGGEDMEDQHPVPREAPQRSVPNLTISTQKAPPQASTSSLPLRQQSRTPPSQGGTPINPLPFRAFQRPTPTSPTNSTHPYQSFSPGPTKTTFLSPRRDRFLPGGMNPIGPPNSAALLSAGLATPYSPYMPFSPITPVTPHLTTRRERRARERDEGRTVPTEEHRVQNEREMWGDGWA